MKKNVDKIKRVKPEVMPEFSVQDLSYDSVLVYSKSEQFFDGNSLLEIKYASISKGPKKAQFEELSEIDSLPEVQRPSLAGHLPGWPRLDVGSVKIDDSMTNSMTKRERDIVAAGSKKNINLHSTRQLKIHAKLSLKLRDKYLRLVKRDKLIKNIASLKQHLKKARVFERVLGRYQKRYEERTGSLHRI